MNSNKRNDKQLILLGLNIEHDTPQILKTVMVKSPKHKLIKALNIVNQRIYLEPFLINLDSCLLI